MPGNFCHSVTGSDASKPAILTCDNICERALKRCFSPLRRRGQYLAKLDPASHCKHFQECRRSRGWSQPLTYNGRASLSTTKGRVTKATKGRATGVLTTNRVTTLPLALPRRNNVQRLHRLNPLITYNSSAPVSRESGRLALSASYP